MESLTMKIKNEDWLELMAGRKVDGVADNDKLFITKIRKALIERNMEKVDCSEEKMAKERKNLLEYLDQQADVAPVISKKPHFLSRLLSLRSFTNAHPIPIAASIMGVVFITLLTTQQTQKNELDITRSNNAKTTLNIVQNVTIKKAEANTIHQQLLTFFDEKYISYQPHQTDNGWELVVELSVEQQVLLNKKLAEYGSQVEKHGMTKIIIIQE